MENQNLQDAYIDCLNEMLPSVDFLKLEQSCNSADDEYAKEILKQMHDIFVKVYGTDSLENSEYEFIEVPAVIRGRKTGHIGLGIVMLDLESSGEHWGTFFFTPKGIVDQNGEKMSDADTTFIKNTYIPYDYWYTVTIERDIHVDFNQVPEKIADLLKGCYPDQPELKM